MAQIEFEYTIYNRMPLVSQSPDVALSNGAAITISPGSTIDFTQTGQVYGIDSPENCKLVLFAQQPSQGGDSEDDDGNGGSQSWTTGSNWSTTPESDGSWNLEIKTSADAFAVAVMTQDGFNAYAPAQSKNSTVTQLPPVSQSAGVLLSKILQTGENAELFVNPRDGQGPGAMTIKPGQSAGPYQYHFSTVLGSGVEHFPTVGYDPTDSSNYQTFWQQCCGPPGSAKNSALYDFCVYVADTAVVGGGPSKSTTNGAFIGVYVYNDQYFYFNVSSIMSDTQEIVLVSKPLTPNEVFHDDLYISFAVSFANYGIQTNIVDIQSKESLPEALASIAKKVGKGILKIVFSGVDE